MDSKLAFFFFFLIPVIAFFLVSQPELFLIISHVFQYNSIVHRRLGVDLEIKLQSEKNQ